MAIAALTMPKAETCPCGHRARMSEQGWANHRLLCAFWTRQSSTGATRSDRKHLRGMGLSA